MDEKKEAPQPPADRHLDTPGEANREKHVNFLEEENTSGGAASPDRARQQEWKDGLAAGEAARKDQA